MNIKRYVAKDMRAALKQVRDEQGPDAVIVSSQRIGEQVEVVAAVDFDMAGRASAKNSAPFDPYAIVDDAREDYGIFDVDFAGHDAASAPSAAGELNALRRMLETQLAALAWNDLTRRAPAHTEVLKELTRLGIPADMAAELTAKLPARAELQELQRMALGLWAHRIPTLEERWIQQGGVVALIGPTGVGKTATLAKIAARWALQNNPRDLALISIDSARIGAHEQVQSIGRLLGASAVCVDGVGELPAAMQEWERRKLILIDTQGASPRDARLPQELAQLAAAHPRLETTLVLSASAQAGAIEECLQRFHVAQPQSCVLTKLDEAASLGGALSAIARVALPIAYVCDGQRVAEDLRLARAHQLAARAVQLAKVSGAAPDEDLLARRFGGIAHALA